MSAAVALGGLVVSDEPPCFCLASVIDHPDRRPRLDEWQLAAIHPKIFAAQSDLETVRLEQSSYKMRLGDVVRTEDLLHVSPRLVCRTRIIQTRISG
jgi:hypothetical protein